MCNVLYWDCVYHEGITLRHMGFMWNYSHLIWSYILPVVQRGVDPPVCS